MNDRNDPIGVFDSGVGGISTLGMMKKILPCEQFIYYGDTLHAPYGTKTTEEVIDCCRRVAGILTGRNIKALVIACNTATGAAAATLRNELPIPVIGLEPALKPASEARKKGDILVMATPLALRQQKFKSLMERFGDGAIPVPCGGLMELVENEDEKGAEEYLRNLFSEFDISRIDAVVLGCTHYVFLKENIRKMLPDTIKITDGNEGAARQLKRVLNAAQLLKEEGEGSVTFMSSSDDPHILAAMDRLYQKALLV